MNRRLTLDENLEALREILRGEGKLKSRYRHSNYERHVRPLVILFNDFLRDEQDIANSYERDQVRYGMLSIIMDREIGSTYDLSAYQCSKIYWYFINPQTTDFREGAERFLSDLALAAQSKYLQSTEPSLHGGPSDMPYLLEAGSKSRDARGNFDPAGYEGDRL